MGYKNIGYIVITVLVLLLAGSTYALDVPQAVNVTPEMKEKMQTLLKAKPKPKKEIPGQLSEYELKNMSSEELVESFLYQPYVFTIIAYSSLDVGFKTFASRFNGLNELLSRDDVFTAALAVYETMNPEGFDPNGPSKEISKHKSRFSYIETLMTQDEVVSKITKKEAERLLSVSLTQYQSKINALDKYGTYGLETTVRLIGKLLKSKKCGYKNANAVNKGDVAHFIETGELLSFDTINAIIKNASENGCK